MEIPGYRIDTTLGKGGMASVYLAVQESFDRKVAIKVMSPQLLADDSFARRFLREARIIARLNHPHIVPVYDVGQAGDWHYMAMEYVGGGHLKQRIRDGMSAREAERVLAEMARALDYAGERGFVHRDVKPDNIMFREDGSAVLMDFGIARAADSEEQMTRMGTVVGTPRYMSPEQHRGADIDPRADIYSLGVVFFEMLTGRTPFTGDDPMAIGIAHIREPIPRLPRELRHYQPLIKRLLAKDPEERFQRGAEVVAALEALTAPGKSAGATPAAPEKPRATFVSGNEQEIKLEPRLRTKEVKEKAGLLSSHLVFDIFLVADDFPQFQKFFEQITTELFEWGEKKGKKCGGVRFKATIHPWIAGRVKEYIRNLRASDSHAFMARVPVQVNLVGADGKPLEQYQLEPENG